MKRKLPNHSLKSFVESVQHENEKMLTRIIHVKPTFQNKEAPKQYPHLIKNLKRKELLEGKNASVAIDYIVKCSEIERENRILLEKMSRILHNKSSTLDEVHN